MIRQQNRPGQKKRKWLLAIAALFVLVPAILWGARIPLTNATAPLLIRYLGIENLGFSILEVTLSRVELDRVTWGENQDVRVAFVAVAIDWDGFSPIISELELTEPEISVGLSDGRLILQPWERMQEKIAQSGGGNVGSDRASPVPVKNISIRDPALQIAEGSKRHTLSGIGNVEVSDLRNISGEIEFTADGPDGHASGHMIFQGQPELRHGKAEVRLSDAVWQNTGIRVTDGQFDVTLDQSGAKLTAQITTDASLTANMDLKISGDPFDKEFGWRGQGKFRGAGIRDQLGKLAPDPPWGIETVGIEVRGSGRVSRSQILQLDPVLLQKNDVSADVTMSGVSMKNVGHADQIVMSARTRPDGLALQKLRMHGVKPNADLMADMPEDVVARVGESFSVVSDDLRAHWVPSRPNGNGALLHGLLAGGAKITSSGGLVVALDFPHDAGFSIGGNVGYLRDAHLDVTVPGPLHGGKLRTLQTTFNLQFYPGAGLGIAGDLNVDLAHFRQNRLRFNDVTAQVRYSGSVSTIGNPWKFKMSPQSLSVGQARIGGKGILARAFEVNEFEGDCAVTPAGWACDLNGTARQGLHVNRQALPEAVSEHARIPQLDFELRVKDAPANSRFPLDGDVGIRLAGIELPGMAAAEPGRIEIGITPESLQGSLNIPSFRLNALPAEPLSLFADGRIQRDKVLFTGQTGLLRKGTPPVRFSGDHVISTGQGIVRLDVDAKNISGLLPVLKSLRAELPLDRLAGQSRISGQMRWGKTGTAGAGAIARFSDIGGDLPDLSFSGVEGEVTLDELQPLMVRSSIPIRIREVSAAGLSLKNIRLDLTVTERELFAETPYILSVKAFSAGLLGGGMRIDPFTATPDGAIDTITSHVDGIDLGKLTSFLAIDGMDVTGRLSGTLPFQLVEEGDVRIDNARFSAPGGGVIRFSSAAARNALQSAGRKEIDLLLQALANFHYDRLDMTLNKTDGPDGELTVKLQGANPDVLNGRQFNINITVTANADRLIRAGLAVYESSSALLWTWLRKR